MLDEALPSGCCCCCRRCSPFLRPRDPEGRDSDLAAFTFHLLLLLQRGSGDRLAGERAETAGGARPRAEGRKGRPELLTSARQAHYPPGSGALDVTTPSLSWQREEERKKKTSSPCVHGSCLSRSHACERFVTRPSEPRKPQLRRSTANRISSYSTLTRIEELKQYTPPRKCLGDNF